MTSDARASGAFDTLAEHLRQEIGAQVKSVLDELAAAALADRDRAVADARSQTERIAQERSADVASAATRAREEGRVEGFAAGKAKAEAEAEQQAATTTPA